jgi:hypothetical protein
MAQICVPVPFYYLFFPSFVDTLQCKTGSKENVSWKNKVERQRLLMSSIIYVGRLGATFL